MVGEIMRVGVKGKMWKIKIEDPYVYQCYLP